MTLVSVANLAKAYGGAVALRAASLDVAAGEAHALMGENGAGKSTLIKILAGATRPDAGEIRIGNAPVTIGSPREAYRLGLRFLHQELNIVPSLSVAENLFLGRDYPRIAGAINWRQLRVRTKNALRRLGVEDIDPDAKLSRLSVGDRMIAQIAATFLEDETHPAKVIVMDEPTAALNATESERLFRIIAELQSQGVGIVYVSHRIDEVLRLADRITVLRDGASSPPMLRSEATRARLIEAMTGRAGFDASARATPATAKPALTLTNLVGDRIGPISLDVHAGEIVGLAGLADAGGDRLLRALIGDARNGEIRIAGALLNVRNPAEAWRRGLAYLPRERRSEGLVPYHSIARNIAMPHWSWLSRLRIFTNPAAELREASSLGARMRLRATGPRQKVASLSGGNQQKTLFARAAAGKPKVLLLDEPTRGVDIGAKYDLHEALRDLATNGAGALVASSDHEELIALCSRIAVIIQGRLAGIVPTQGLTTTRLLALCYGEATS